MPLAAGARLGPYEVLAPIGSGGMGDVYRARDTRLDRTVAIKVLPPQLAGDPQFRDRFEREARVIASLQHPHICALFDVGTAPDPSRPTSAGNEVRYLVLEYLDGETLAARVARTGALPLAEALRIGVEICDALDRAHRAHIIHRDLKPANVMLTKSGSKLLDFGLAKAAAPVVATTGRSMLPTAPPELTAQGAILGTFQYMAPEQIEGLDADPRTDIFAFGALLFEMVTGRTAFEGKTRASLLGAILKDDPPHLTSLRAEAPTAIDRIVRICLAKDPDDRYQSARDLLRDLREVQSNASVETTPSMVSATRPPQSPARSHRGWSVAVAAAIAALVGVAGLVVGRWSSPSTPALVAEPIQFVIPPPSEATFLTPPSNGSGQAPQAVVSPDGKMVAFVAHTSKGFSLWVRSIARLEPRILPGTEDAAFPFWSPDSRWLGFFAQGKLKKVALDGGNAIVLCPAESGRGGTWNQENVIVFAPDTRGPLQRVSAAGGVPVPASTLDTQYGDTNHRFPFFLPDGRHFLFTAVVGICCPASKPGRLEVGALDTMEASTVMDDIESSVTFAAAHLLYNRTPAEGQLMVQPFDANERHVTGDPFPLALGVASEGSRYASFSASTGVLVYATGRARPVTQLTWMDRAGKNLGTIGEAAYINSIGLSSDDRYIAASLATGRPENRDIWVFDSQQAGAPSRFTFDPGDDAAPVWSPSRSQIVFRGVRGVGTRPRLLSKDAKGTGNEEALFSEEAPAASTNQFVPTDWSADGRYIVFNTLLGNTTSSDLYVLPLFGDRTAMPIAQSSASETGGAFSPDGRWIAYSSNESGAPQVYVQPFPTRQGVRWQVSQNGGVWPTWSRDGRELFFLGVDGRLMVVPVKTAGGFEHGSPTALFALSTLAVVGAINYRQYAISSDGTRVLVNVLQRTSETTPLTVVHNWLAMRN